MAALENSRFSLAVFTPLPNENLIELNAQAARDFSTNTKLLFSFFKIPFFNLINKYVKQIFVS